jgi:toxin CcdB
MAQFDIHRNPGQGPYAFVVDVQADLLAQLDTRVVVPMIARARYAGTPLRRLDPIVTHQRSEYVVVVQLLATVPRSVLGRAVGSLAAKRAELIAAFDLLLTGS